jgi:hypothetical protein
MLVAVADFSLGILVQRIGDERPRRRTGRTAQRNGTEKGREIGIRRGRSPNVHGNGKTERKRRDERDVVLTFGQG